MPEGGGPLYELDQRQHAGTPVQLIILKEQGLVRWSKIWDTVKEIIL